MNQQEAEANKWRCPDCGTPLETSRGGVYYCPTLKCNTKIEEALHGNKNKKTQNESGH